MDGIVVANFLGVQVHAVTQGDLVRLIRAAVEARARLIVGNHNLNSLALVRRSETMRAFYNECGVVYADGMPVVAIARLLGHAFRREHRITSIDFIGDIFRVASERGWRVFYLGSTRDVIHRAAGVFRARHPGLQLFVRDGYFNAAPDSHENAEVLSEINRAAPDILIVGMGMPRQEEWTWRNRADLNATVLFPIGALADYTAGAVPTPPRWAGRVGLEWAFRLIAEPRRLSRRYLVEPWVLVGPVALELLKVLKRSLFQKTPESQG